jgi:hypothetical protein
MKHKALALCPLMRFNGFRNAGRSEGLDIVGHARLLWALTKP